MVQLILLIIIAILAVLCISECMLFNMDMAGGANIMAIADLLKTEEPESDSDEDMKVFIMDDKAELVKEQKNHCTTTRALFVC